MTKRYKVVGVQPVLDGHEPGSTFEAELSPELEASLIGSGSIEVVQNAAPTPPTELKRKRRILPDIAA